MKKAPQSAGRAFTIIEVIVIVVILGVIAMAVGPRLFSHVGKSKRAIAQTNANALATSMKLFAKGETLEPGTSIRVLWERPANVDEGSWEPLVDNEDALKDPWGNLYVLVIPGQFNVDFDVVSYGKDGQPGGEGENEDIISGKR